MQISVMGAGLIGRPMAERLKAIGHTVTVYNRTLDKVRDLLGRGIAVAERPEDAIRGATCIILILADAVAIRDLLRSDPVRAHLAGRTAIQMGTIGPRESLEFHDYIVAAGGDYLEAPVLGSIAEASTGTLAVMVGASPTQFERWFDVLRGFGPDPRLIGPVGSASALKLALNNLIAAQISAFSLSLGLVQKHGVPVDTFMAILRNSALHAGAFERKLPRLLARNYADPNFSTKHLLKDVELILDEAEHLNLETAGLQGMRTLLKQAMRHGLRDVDYSAVYEVVNPGSTAHGELSGD